MGDAGSSLSLHLGWIGGIGYTSSPSVVTCAAELEPATGFSSFGALARQSTTVGNIFSSNQKKQLFQFFMESKGFV
ncbi:hypothetical protein Tco_1152660 [Tanacetum coccineum]